MPLQTSSDSTLKQLGFGDNNERGSVLGEWGGGRCTKKDVVGGGGGWTFGSSGGGWMRQTVNFFFAFRDSFV